MSYQSKEITVLGAGSWGTALALVVAENFKRVKLWGRNAAVIEQVAKQRCNTRYLPDIVLSENIVPVTDFNEAIENSAGIIVATPGACFAETLTTLKQALTNHSSLPDAIIWGTKGLGAQGALLSEVAEKTFGDRVVLGVISGPGFAKEVAKKMPTALTVASTDNNVTSKVAQWFQTPTMRIYHSSDLVGVQLGGAIKNVIAIAVGISDGLGYGVNARSALITRGLSELTRLGVALGGQAETLAGLSGLGDLILTCTDDQSRNRLLGLGLGRGQKQQQVIQQVGQAIEGISTTKVLFALAQDHQIEMPIVEQVYRVLYLDQPPEESVAALLKRHPGVE